MLPDKPLHTALADAVVLGELPLRRTSTELLDKLAELNLSDSIADSPRMLTAAR